MRRRQITQIVNTQWCPAAIKRLLAEFLSWFVVKVNATKPFVPVIEKAMADAKTQHIVNIAFPIGAGIETVQPYLHPGYSIESIPFTGNIPPKTGLFLFVNAFHQLPVAAARQTLESIAQSRNPIVIVEGNNDSLWQLVGMTIIVPLTVIVTAPFVQPFRWSRILFTYVIPILPFFIVYDGCAALLKLYNPSDLNKLTSSLEHMNYQWTSGKHPNGRGGKIIYLTGIPLGEKKVVQF